MPELFLGFNQHGENLACAKLNEFHIFDSEKGTLLQSRPCKDVKFVEMLFQSNLIGLIVGEDRVMLWDENKQCFIAEIPFRETVLGLRLSMDQMVVILQTKIIIYKLQNMARLQILQTCDNPDAHCAWCAGRNILATLGTLPGMIQVHGGTPSGIPFQAHTSRIAGIAISTDGGLLATCSQTGTVIRVFDILGCLMYEFRRGFVSATITCLRFSENKKWLAIASTSGSIHVFRLEASLLARFLPTWSFAQFTLPTERSKFAVSFSREPFQLLAVSEHGLSRISWNPQLGTCALIDTTNLFHV